MKNYYGSYVRCPLGMLYAISSGKGIIYLAFTDKIDVQAVKDKYSAECNALIKNESNDLLNFLEKELELYFKGKLKVFNTPIELKGTDFQKEVWRSLLQIPYGQTWSYEQQARFMEQPLAIRAIASSNGKNPISILIPCHRVIGKNGSLTGYAGGLDRKKALLKHELEFRSPVNTLF